MAVTILERKNNLYAFCQVHCLFSGKAPRVSSQRALLPDTWHANNLNIGTLLLQFKNISHFTTFHFFFKANSNIFIELNSNTSSWKLGNCQALSPLTTKLSSRPVDVIEGKPMKVSGSKFHAATTRPLTHHSKKNMGKW